jgi:5-methylcytosine-specific restriction endonuclease McrA
MPNTSTDRILSERILTVLKDFVKSKEKDETVEPFRGTWAPVRLHFRLTDAGSLKVQALWTQSPSYNKYKRPSKKFTRRHGFSEKSLENLSVDIWRFLDEHWGKVKLAGPLYDYIEEQLDDDQKAALANEARNQGFCDIYEEMSKKDIDGIYEIILNAFTKKETLQILNFFAEDDVTKAFDKLGCKQAQRITYCPDGDGKLPFLIAQAFFEEGLAVKVMRKPSDDIVMVIADSKNFQNPKNRRPPKGSGLRKRGGDQPKPKKKYQSERKPDRYTPQEVLDKVRCTRKNTSDRENFDGDMMMVTSVRMRTFKHKGCRCASCGIEGTVFMKDRHTPEERWHFNLYAEKDDGEMVMMTKDHIMPRSKGGSNALRNMQTMCLTCNQEKADKVPEHLKQSRKDKQNAQKSKESTTGENDEL